MYISGPARREIGGSCTYSGLRNPIDPSHNPENRKDQFPVMNSGHFAAFEDRFRSASG